jgi:hypothetical protein
MAIQNFSEYNPMSEGRYYRGWKQIPWYAHRWEAICPITNRWIEGYEQPTTEELNYRNYKDITSKQDLGNFRMWIDEPYLKDNGKFAPFHSELSIRINDCDDSYWCRDYEFTADNYDEVLSQALEVFELIKLATTKQEIIDTAMNLDFLDF